MALPTRTTSIHLKRPRMLRLGCDFAIYRLHRASSSSESISSSNPHQFSVLFGRLTTQLVPIQILQQLISPVRPSIYRAFRLVFSDRQLERNPKMKAALYNRIQILMVWFDRARCEQNALPKSAGTSRGLKRRGIALQHRFAHTQYGRPVTTGDDEATLNCAYDCAI